MCVRISSVRRVLQFTPHNAVSCVLHRSAIRVIHRLQSYRLFLRINVSNDQCVQFVTTPCDSANAYTSLAPAALEESRRNPENKSRIRHRTEGHSGTGVITALHGTTSYSWLMETHGTGRLALKCLATPTPTRGSIVRTYSIQRPTTTPGHYHHIA